ncbi:DNA recombination protein RmuC [Tenacibaculum ovolyticum]|uniref:DNA recombination protein RmuC n=1 Tax=Tenacibaculum ovolyticum TaxID=104270 RepID=UPI0007ED8749|nr:DNA recombination protein RmuC [Tenacibaculum ovolyticum]
MNTEIILIILIAINIIITLIKKLKIDFNFEENFNETKNSLIKFNSILEKTDKTLKDEFQRNREETNSSSKNQREELAKSLSNFKDSFENNTKDLNDLLKNRFDNLNKKQTDINQQNREENNKYSKNQREELTKSLDNFKDSFDNNTKRLNDLLKDRFDTFSKQQTDINQQNREENNNLSKKQREELTKTLNNFKESFEHNTKKLNELLENRFDTFSKQQTDINQESEKRIKDVKESVEKQLLDIRKDNTEQLNEMRKTVDEKLQKTINDRLSQSFETVSKQLKSVQEGLGEMKNLAEDVGGLKKVLSNVKMRGGIGEVQLEMLLEQILAPDQYESNVKTKKDSSGTVEFAIKLPGRDDSSDVVWLPIDAKFPKDIFEKLQDAYDDGDQNKIVFAQKELDNTIKKMAKDISQKYIDPPNTTDFGIMFLPFEGIYAEVVRKSSLLETLQRDFKIIVTGPTTLAAILNSLQMGFKTLAIQKRSSEVWSVLSDVKKEFTNFGGIMQKAQKNIQTGLNQLDDVMGKRTRAIQRKLNNVTLLEEKKENILTELNEVIVDMEDENPYV